MQLNQTGWSRLKPDKDFLQGVVLSRPMGDIQSVCKDMDSKQFTNIYFSASTVEDWKQKAQMVK
jgi:hypothetical protein